jgi:hypothetical protein
VKRENEAPGRPDWAASAIGEEAYEALASALPPSEVWSLLLAVLARRAEDRAPADVLRQWQRDPFTRVSAVDQRTMVALDTALLGAAEGFEAVELSPLAPLGACSAVSLGSQNRVVSALRGTEVVADPTNVLALECARRLRERPGQAVRLATCHRCVRTQPAPKGPGFAQHFRLFCLATAGREQKDHGFLAAALVEQIRTHLGALDRLEADGYEFPGREVRVLATPARAALADRVAAAIRGVPVSRAQLDHRYYDGVRFQIFTDRTPPGGFALIDGGSFDWVAKLLSNRSLVYAASGMGEQLVATQFRRR